MSRNLFVWVSILGLAKTGFISTARVAGLNWPMGYWIPQWHHAQYIYKGRGAAEDVQFQTVGQLSFIQYSLVQHSIAWHGVVAVAVSSVLYITCFIIVITIVVSFSLCYSSKLFLS